MRRLTRLSAALALVVLACSRRPDPAPASAAIAPAAAIESAAPLAATSAPPPTPASSRVPAAPMSYRGAGWLERADRDRVQQPEKLLDALHLRAGDTVADVGAGTGYFSLRIARRVAPNGRVLATDIQPEMLRLLEANAKAAGIRVETILASDTDAKLPPDAVDLVLMVDVYHELAHPAATLQQVKRALRQSGRLALVEYRAEDPKVEIKPEHKMTAEGVRGEVEPQGFRLSEQLEFLPEQHVFVFVKAR